MSKHLGNILEPIPLMDQHGADAVRWFMLAAGSPWSARRVGHKVLDEIASKVHSYILVGGVVPVAVRASQRVDAGCRPRRADGAGSLGPGRGRADSSPR